MITEIAVALPALLTLLCSYRVIKGPDTTDRVVALDAIGTNIISLGVLHAIVTDKQFFINISLMLAITGFMATVVTAMYVREGDIIK
jgi:multisubunit Na+/H+ antiporter MnhF subunit